MLKSKTDSIFGKISSSGLRWFWLTIIFFILDQVSKQYAVEHLFLGERINLLPIFDFTLRYNTGAAFSLFADQDGWQVYFFTSISILVGGGLIYWLYTLPAKNWWLSISLNLILAGAFGNLYDRIAQGKVTDFILFYYHDWHFPAFNIADSVIFLGAAMMLYDSFVNPETAQSEKSKDGNVKAPEKSESYDKF
ncbi:MAG: signal peptidase II [Enterobacterales bacterium]|nr:signal peptidase II [Enterobacterales bacterium]